MLARVQGGPLSMPVLAYPTLFHRPRLRAVKLLLITVRRLAALGVTPYFGDIELSSRPDRTSSPDHLIRFSSTRGLLKTYQTRFSSDLASTYVVVRADVSPLRTIEFHTLTIPKLVSLTSSPGLNTVDRLKLNRRAIQSNEMTKLLFY
jgi:hypothetical protein